MSEIRVYNKHYESPKGPSVYIGRPSKWGNPFSHLKDTKAEFKVKDRKTAVEEYRKWLLDQPELIEQAKSELKGKHLLCWCHPAPCHGNVLIEVANVSDEIKNDYFALVGSREGPTEQDFKTIKEAGRLITEAGFGISSGDAIGTDRAFHEGCMESVNYHKLNHRIYVVDFNGNRYNRAKHYGHFIDASKLEMRDEAIRLVQSVVPHFNYIKPYSQDLHTRNVYQILGSDLQTPVKALIYWAPPKGNLDDEIVKGGTNTALQLAKRYNIPYRLNLAVGRAGENLNALKTILRFLKDELTEIKVERCYDDEYTLDLTSSHKLGLGTMKTQSEYNKWLDETEELFKYIWLDLLMQPEIKIRTGGHDWVYDCFVAQLDFMAYKYGKVVTNLSYLKGSSFGPINEEDFWTK